MPPKRRAIGRSTPQARKRRVLQASESDEQRELRLENLQYATETRSSESSDQREEVPKFYTWNASTKRFQRRSLAVEGHFIFQ
ncbi:hypothetical protein TNCV_3193401 [Trichonephila clavipes]|nr:hypothetical protein TNCV_3193401 [Trichonephila clavipes]